MNKPTSVAVIDEQPQSGESPSGVTTTMTYDDLGRLTRVNEPDQGTLVYSYDPDGHATSVVQTSGSSTRTLGTNYDLLGRVGCEQDAAPTSVTWNGACTAGNPLVQNTYDTTKLGTQGSTDFPVGHLTQSVATTYYPESTSATVTQQFQTDQRGRTITTQLQLGLPSSWNVTSALPTSQVALLYNDANQVTTTSATAGTAMYTFTQVYDPTNGVLQGLSDNGSSTADLATLAYNEYAQLSGITSLAGSSTQVASVQYGYDGDLRPNSLTASWLPGSGNSGQILAQGRRYDNAGNVTSVNTTYAAVPGQTGSGGAETQNFCYDEQSRLIWAGNGGTQPSAGNGTCGSGTLSNSLSGAGYTSPFVYTNLGQMWQGPVNGQGSAQQYFYCHNGEPHQLTGIYALGDTCASHGVPSYLASYDPWGNMTSRTYNNVTATLSYDALNHLVEYNAGSSGQEWYLYDASGNRVLKRSTSAGSTTLTSYAFGLQELSYNSSGVYSSQIDYYSLAGHPIGWTDGANTTYDLTDAQGSVLTSFSKSAIQGEQAYGPYGNQRYSMGAMGTDKGYTGQFHDSVTGLDYYNARYYDPVAGVFLSPDSVQGNAQGMDPYSYVAGNPETRTDPTGQRVIDPGGGGSGSGCPSGEEEVSGGCTPDPGRGGTQPPTSGCTGGTKMGANCPTGGPAPTPTPSDGKNHTCHASAAQCAQGEQNRNNQNTDLQKYISWLQLFSGAFGFILDLKALISGGIKLSDAVKFWGKIIDVIGDLSTMISAVASLTGSGLFQEVAGVVATVFNAAKAIYHAAMGSWWVTTALIAGYYTLQATFFTDDFVIDQASNALIALAGTAIGKAIGKEDMDLAAIGSSFFQAGIGFLQTQIQMNNDSSVDQFI